MNYKYNLCFLLNTNQWLNNLMCLRFGFLIASFCLFVLLFHADARSQSKFEMNVSAFYGIPQLETYGDKVDFTLLNEVITIGGKRLMISDNFGTTYGFGFNISTSYNLFKTNYVKILGGLGYSQFQSKYDAGDGFSYGTRLNIFSVGAGLQLNPVGMHKFYPSIVGLFRFNEVGGESFYKAGEDFFIVSPRFGISTGLDLNYKFNKRVGLCIGARYNYDNLLNKQAQETVFADDHVIVFRDLMSPTNGLEHNRRVAYISILTGINIYFK